MTAQTYILTATILAWAALGLFVFALLGDSFVQRVKRLCGTARRRCPRCWYDLSHTPGGAGGSITCSECGRVVTRERQLYRGRKRWKLAAVAVLLLLGSYALRVTPGVRDRGWVAAVPTTVMVLGMPWIEPSDWFSQQLPPIMPGPLLQPTRLDELAVELIDFRLRRRSIWKWQESLIVERCLKGDRVRRPVSPEWSRFYGVALHELARNSPQRPAWRDRAEKVVEVTIETRPHWPRGVPIYGRPVIRRWNDEVDHRAWLRPAQHNFMDVEVIRYNRRSQGGAGISDEQDRLMLLGESATTLDHLEYLVEIDTCNFADSPVHPCRWLIDLTMYQPLRVDGDVNDILMPVATEEVHAALRRQIDPLLILRRDSGSLRPSLYLLWSRDPGVIDEFAPLAGITIAIDIEVRYDGEAVGRGTGWFAGRRDVFRGEPILYWTNRAPQLSWTLDHLPLDPRGEWTMLIRSNPELALRNFESNRYWKGEIEVPITVEVRER